MGMNCWNSSGLPVANYLDMVSGPVGRCHDFACAALMAGAEHMPDGVGFQRTDPSRGVPEDVAKRLIVALDVADVKRAQELVTRLDGVVSFFKIGLWLLFEKGVDRLLDRLHREHKDIFLDYKMYDIGETVKRGVEKARKRGIKFVTVHGDPEIMCAAVDGKGDSDFLKIFAITVLTSLNDEALKKMGYRLTVNNLVELRVKTAIRCGCDGVIASPLDQPDEIRRLAKHPGLLIATPGIRRSGSAVDEHKRAATPTQAILSGADYLIVGREITQSHRPEIVANEIITEMREAAERRKKTLSAPAASTHTNLRMARQPLLVS